MSDLDYGIRITGDATGAKAAVQDVSAGLGDMSHEAVNAKARMDELAAAQAKHSAASQVNVQQLTVLENEYHKLAESLDPAARAQALLAQGQATLGASLKNGIISQAEYTTTLGLLSSQYAGAAAGAEKSAFATANARRELIVLGHEAMTGNFSRMPGSVMVLAERLGATAMLFNPITIGIAAVGAGAAVFGVAVAHAESFNRVLNSMEIQLEATGRGSMMSRDDLKSLIDQMALLPGMSTAVAEKSLAAFAQVHQLGASMFQGLALIVNDFAAAMGIKAPDAAKKLAAAMADPVAGLKDLDKKLGTVTASQMLSAEQMQKGNDLAGAQKVYYDAVTQSVAGLAEKGLTPLQKAENDAGNAWHKMTKSMDDSEVVKHASDAVVGLVNGLTWIIDHAGQIGSVMERAFPLVWAGLASTVGAANLLASAASTGNHSAAGKIGTAPLTAASASAQAIDDQIKRALKLGDAYSSLTERAKALEVTQRAVNDALNVEAASANPDAKVMKKLGDQSLALTKAVADAWRAAGADGRQATRAQIDGQLKLSEIGIGMAQAQNDAQLKLKNETKAEHDATKLFLDLKKNEVEQIAVTEQQSEAGLTALEKQKLALKLEELKAEADAIALNGNNAQLVDENAALLAQQKLLDGTVDSINKLGAADLKRLDASIAAQKLHNDTIGKTKDQIESAKQSVEDLGTAHMQVEADAISAMLVEQKNNAYVLEVYGAILGNLNKQIAARKELAAEMGQGAALQATADATKAYQQDWKRANDEISRYLSDALMHGFDKGQSFVKTFITTTENAFKTMVLMPVIKFILSPVTGAIASTMAGMGISGAAGAAGGTSAPMGVGGWLNAGSALHSGYNALTGGFSSAYTSFAQSGIGSSLGLSASSTAAEASTANSITAMGQTVGTALSYVGAGLAGIAVGSMIAGDKKVIGLDGKSISAIGAVIGSFWGPVGTFIGGAAGGILDAAFGMGPKKSDTTTMAGVFNQYGFNGQYNTPWNQSGGWFRSDKSGTDVQGMSAASINSMSAVLQGTESVFNKLTTTAGESNRALGDWQFNFNRVVATAADQKQVIIDMANSMGAKLVPELTALQQSGESLADTAVRLNDEFLATDALAQMLGKDVASAFGAVGLASAAMRDNLVTAMGGLQSMTTSVQFFYQHFYTDAERLANDTKSLDVQFAALGLSVPASRDAFRALVESQNLSTQSGQTLFAALMQIAPAFDAVQTATAAATAAAVAAAPAVQTLADQITKLQQDTTTAIDALISASQTAASAAKQSADAYRAAATTMRDTITQLRGGSLSTLSPGQKLTESGATLDSVFAGALSGDPAALAKLPQTATDFLNASQAYNASSQAYASDFQRVMDMLNQAGVASTAYAGTMDYQTTLLDTQTKLLQAIKVELALPSPDAAVLNQQTTLLGTIGDLLRGQTQQLITVNSSLTDQTGQLIVGNAKVDAQTGQLQTVGATQVAQITAGVASTDTVAANVLAGNVLIDAQTGQVTAVNSSVQSQTDQVSTGNSTASAIKDITDASKGISASMLTALLTSAQTQSDNLSAVLTGTALTNTLLQQLVGNLDAQAYATWQAKFQTDAAAIWSAIQADASIVNKMAAFDQQWSVWQQANPMPSHAAGLPVVPHDNYAANLHANEAVIDAPTMASLRRYGIPVSSGAATANPEQLAEQRKTNVELGALVRLQSAANQALLEKLGALEKRFAGFESKARLAAA